jgi:nucleoid DNA-binding protein
LNDLTKDLSEGRIVRFGDFGSFSISLSSEGAETADKFNSSMIKGAKIAFRPGIDLKEMLAIMKFEKAK